MFPRVAYDLHDDLGAVAERFFGEPLAGVDIVVDDLPRRLGVAACAGDQAVFLAPDSERLPRWALLELLGHELTHVVQQRRRPLANRGQGWALELNPVAEREARALGHEFALTASGALCRSTPALVRRIGRPPARTPCVVQPSVNVNERRLDRVGALSSEAQQVLSLIAGGSAWLAWAIDSNEVAHAFGDESALLLAVQTGLHDSPLAVVPSLDLWVSPAVLMALSAESFGVVMKAAGGDPRSLITTQVQAILAEEGFVTQAQCAAARSFLADLEVGSSPILSVMNLEAWTAVVGLMQTSRVAAAGPKALSSDAAGYAVARSVNAFEFVDLFRAYLNVVSARELESAPLAERETAVSGQTEALRDSIYSHLNSVVVPALSSPEAVSKQLRLLQGTGRMVGFVRLAHGIEQIIDYAVKGAVPLGHANHGERTIAKGAVDQYFADLDALVAKQLSASARLCQDGQRATYVLEDEETRAEFVLAADGQLTIGSFAKVAPTTAAPTPDHNDDSNVEETS